MKEDQKPSRRLALLACVVVLMVLGLTGVSLAYPAIIRVTDPKMMPQAYLPAVSNGYPLPTHTSTPTKTATPTETPGPTDTPSPTQTPIPGMGLCPIDMSLPGVYLFARWIPGVHHGIDIIGPYGTPHRAPDYCEVYALYIGDNGDHGVKFKCPQLDIDNLNLGWGHISLGHGDFSYNDHDTLRWYGIPIDTFFESDGSPKTGVTAINPTKNRDLSPGDDLHFYMACTGNCGLVHTHVSLYIWNDGEQEWLDGGDPNRVLDCSSLEELESDKIEPFRSEN